MTTSRNQLAARAIVLNARDHDEARMLLDMIGLVDETGRAIVPDESPVAIPAPIIGSNRGAHHGNLARMREEPRPDNCTTPAGLWGEASA